MLIGNQARMDSRFSVNMPKNDEYSAGNIIGMRVSNTTTSVQKNIKYETVWRVFQIHSFS